jgi:hypothetical protein
MSQVFQKGSKQPPSPKEGGRQDAETQGLWCALYGMMAVFGAKIGAGIPSPGLLSALPPARSFYGPSLPRPSTGLAPEPRSPSARERLPLSFPFEILRWPSRSTHRIGPTLFLLLFDAVKVALTAQEELPADDRRGSAEAVVQRVHRQRLRRVVAMAQDLRDAV